jgi:hypothetical protein
VKEPEQFTEPVGAFVAQMPDDNHFIFAADNRHGEFFFAGKFLVFEFALNFGP